MSDYDIPGYRIEGELGRGGMASVYLARQESLNRRVALKIMNPALGADKDFKTRFLNEGRIVAQLNHNYIVTIYDIGCHGHYHYLSMEYLPGGTLRERIRAGLSLQHSLRIAHVLGSALHYAHQQGIVHRDIKPLNVLFRQDGSPVLTDFGIAKVIGGESQLTQTGFAVGSVGYMSPEQALGRPIDHRADLYAFGLLLWEMFTGKPPFAASDPFALALKHATEPLPRLPAELMRCQPLFSRLLAKQPEDRYPGLDQCLLALAAVAHLLGVNMGTAPASPALLPLTESEEDHAADMTVIRAPSAPKGMEEVAWEESVDTSEGMVLTLVEREQRRLIMRLPDYLDALRITDKEQAGKYLQFCDQVLQTSARLTGDYLQTLGLCALSAGDFDRLHTAMDRHARLNTLVSQLLEFSEIAATPLEGQSLRELKDSMMEGLDAILLILRDAVEEDSDTDTLAMVRIITGDRSEMMQQLRQSYLTDATLALSNSDKMLLLKLPGQFERLIWALGALVQRV